jgi:hypothetical protein
MTDRSTSPDARLLFLLVTMMGRARCVRVRAFYVQQSAPFFLFIGETRKDQRFSERARF